MLFELNSAIFIIFRLCIFCPFTFATVKLEKSNNIAMEKLTQRNVTAGMLSQNFKETVKQFTASDEAFSFMKAIKGTQLIGRHF